MSKFTDFAVAARDMRQVTGIVLLDAVFMAEAIEQGQRFYLPGDCSLIEGKLLRDLTPILNHPFKDYSILTECPFEDGRTSKLIVGIHVSGNGRDFEICCCDYNEELRTPRWGPMPVALCEWMPDGGIFVNETNSDYAQKINGLLGKKYTTEIKPCITAVLNLMVLLSLKNVSAELVEPPAKIAKKHQRKHDLPLFSYHVLNVGGDRWASRGVDDGDGCGFRSHLRRGHIRRLADGRQVWVREAFVHGRIDGWVQKDYNGRSGGSR